MAFASLLGQSKDNLPAKSYLGLLSGPATKTSATPPPSEPGSQATTKASELLISALAQRGRPVKKTLITGIFSALSLRSKFKSEFKLSEKFNKWISP